MNYSASNADKTNARSGNKTEKYILNSPFLLTLSVVITTFINAKL